MLHEVLKAYGIGDKARIMPFGNGLINSTWKVEVDNNQYILQKVNNTVFKQPEDIAYNIGLLKGFLKSSAPDYLFVAPIETIYGDEMVHTEEGYFRLLPFVTNSYTKQVVETPQQAYEAAAQFGQFTHLLSRFNAAQLKPTIPHFHDLDLRYQQFLQALENGNEQRISDSKYLITQLVGEEKIVVEYRQLVKNPQCRLRVTHHDTKISNVLLDDHDKGLCVIDLDTVMPGYFFSDVGDMMRTYLSPVSEEEKDFEKIVVRKDFYKAIVQGYCSQMKEELTATEKQLFFYAGKMMIYMQALRFCTDHLNNDVYYGAEYVGHNLIRAQNQVVLLQQLIDAENDLKNIGCM